MLSLNASTCNTLLSNAITSAAAGAALPAVRGLAVLSWGRNVEGQCGVETSLLVLRPTPVIELHNASLASVSAGKLNSGAVTADGDAWTWGDGQGGKLGHGTAQHVHAPHRVESLVGRAAVRQLALGDHHTLFVDSAGGLWACGENKEGQCGLGTPLEVIASQHRRAYYEAFRPLRDTVAATEPHASREQRAKQAIHALMGTAGGSGGQHPTGPSVGFGAGPSHGSAWGPNSRTSGWHALAAAGSHTPSPSSSSATSGARLALNFAGLDVEGAFSAAGIHPGQAATPLRIGRDQHPLWSAVTATGASTETGAAGSFGIGREVPGEQMRMVLPSGLEEQSVLRVAASRYFSAALTEGGEVWTFGACYNGSLGTNRSWSTSAQKVTGPLAAALEAEGGAQHVVAGGTFCAALTASGRVVVWGKLPGSEGEGGSLGGVEAAAGDGGSGGGCALGLTSQGVDIVHGGRVVAGMLPNLGTITQIAAGQQHLLLTDGQRVWVVGRMLDGAGGVASTAPWRRPTLVLTLPHDDTVRQLVAGVHSSGVVSEHGEVWVWGRLLDKNHAESVVRRHPHLAYDSGVMGSGAHAATAARPLLQDDVRWGWAGFGGREPTRVEGLDGRVRALALGGWHALAVVE